MNAHELVRVLPGFLEEYLEGAQPQRLLVSDDLPDRGWWWLRQGRVVAVLGVHPEGQVRVTVGVAIGVPWAPETSHYINRLNFKQVRFGRLFLVGNDETGLGTVLMQEIVSGDSLSWDFPPSMQNFLLIVASLCGQGDRFAADICENVGGRLLTDDEAMLVMMHE
jgi:hypothetical protein